MKSIVRPLFASATIAAALFAVPAMAQEADAPGGDSLTIAAGGATIPDYEGSDDRRIIPGGAVRGQVSGFAFSTLGTKLFVDAIRNERGPVWDVQFGPVIGVNMNRSGKVDDTRVRALGKVKTAVEAGAYLGIAKTCVFTSDYDRLGASVTYVADVGNVHKSYVITPSINYGTPLSRKAYVGISLSADYAGDGYIDTYYNITPAKALASGLPAYSGDGGFKSVSVGMLGTVSLTGDLLGGLSLIGGVQYKRLTGDAARSPVVAIAGSRDQWSGALGLAYTF